MTQERLLNLWFGVLLTGSSNSHCITDFVTSSNVNSSIGILLNIGNNTVYQVFKLSCNIYEAS